jgi:hypothetical protein
MITFKCSAQKSEEKEKMNVQKRNKSTRILNFYEPVPATDQRLF